MDLALRERLVVVTGASAGIGRATALALAREGASLLLAARDPSRLDVVAAQAVEAGAALVETTSGDLTTPDGVAALADRAAQLDQRCGPVHGLVTCVGSTPLGTFDDLDDATWQRAFDMKFMATVRVVRALLPALRRGSGGRIVIIAGNSALAPDPWMATSAAINAALASLTSTLARQLAPEGLGVACVHPGPTRTSRLDGLAAAVAARSGVDVEEGERQVVEGIPLGRLADPDDVGSVVAYLCSPLAAHVTGTSVTVDGAQSPAR